MKKHVDYYELLQVSPKAHTEVIRSAYRTIMSKLDNHPDKGGDEEKAKLINEAYEVLMDSNKRSIYDKTFFNYQNTPNTNQNFSAQNERSSIKVVENLTLNGHSRAVELLSVGCGDEILASCHNSGFFDNILGFISNDYDTKVKMWDLQSGEEVRYLSVEESKINTLQIGKSNILFGLATPSFIRVGSIDSLETLFSIEADYGEWGPTAFNYDLSLVAVGVDDGVQLLDLAKNKIIKVFKQKSLPDFIRFSGDGQVLLAVNNEQNIIQMWSISDKKNIIKIKIKDNFAAIFALNNTGKILALYNYNSSIAFLNTFNNVKIKEIYYEATALNFSNSDQYFVLGDTNGVVRIFDLNSFNEILSFKAHNEEINAICFTDDCSKIITACSDSSIKVFEIIALD